MGMTTHCCGFLCDGRLKNFRHRTAGTKVVYFGAFVTIGARRLCPESWLGERTRWSWLLCIKSASVIFFLLATFFNRGGVHGVHSAAGLVVTYA